MFYFKGNSKLRKNKYTKSYINIFLKLNQSPNHSQNVVQNATLPVSSPSCSSSIQNVPQSSNKNDIFVNNF